MAPPQPSSDRGPALRANDIEHHDWSGYWALQLVKWRQYDLLSTISTAVLVTFNAWRCTITSSSYSMPAYIRLVRQVQACFVLSQCLCLSTVWLLLRRPLVYQRFRSPLTIGRSLAVSMLVLRSTPLPLFQAMRLPRLCPVSGVPCRLLELLFHCGALYTGNQFLFHPLPWQMAGLNGLIYATLAAAFMPRLYCDQVLAATAAVGCTGGQQPPPPPHPDAALLHGLANRLDLLTGQGSMGQGSSMGQVWGTAAAAAGGDAQGQQGWQSDTAIIAAACPPALVAAAGGGGSGGCAASLHGQCQAVVMMLQFSILLLMTTIVFVNERVNKWRYLQHHPGARPRARGDGGASSSSGAGSSGARAGGPAACNDRSGGGLFGSPYDAPSVAVLVRNEALRFVLLLDLPLLMLWWGLSGWLRPPLVLPGAPPAPAADGA